MRESSAPFRCLLVGVGGQGVQTAAAILGDAGASAGLDARVGWLHGMSQRGGSVQNTVLFGPGITSFVGHGEADLVIGFEPLETQRALPLMAGHTKVAINTGRVVPFSIAASGLDYPSLDQIGKEIRSVTARITQVDALAAAHEAGSARTLNIVMLGVVAEMRVLPVSADILLESVERHSSEAALAANRQAFELGMKSITVTTGTGR